MGPRPDFPLWFDIMVGTLMGFLALLMVVAIVWGVYYALMSPEEFVNHWWRQEERKRERRRRREAKST